MYKKCIKNVSFVPRWYLHWLDCAIRFDVKCSKTKWTKGIRDECSSIISCTARWFHVVWTNSIPLYFPPSVSLVCLGPLLNRTEQNRTCRFSNIKETFHTIYISIVLCSCSSQYSTCTNDLTVSIHVRNLHDKSYTGFRTLFIDDTD